MATSDKDNDFLDYNLPQNAYVAFDAVSLKDYIVNRLNTNEKFTDQNYDGSKLSGCYRHNSIFISCSFILLKQYSFRG